MADYFTILTSQGKAAVANATALGTAISIAEMAIGDGGGAAMSPTAEMTALVNEVYRAEINNIAVETESPTIMRVELIVPTTVGGWTAREVGVFDDAGRLFAVGNFPDTYKPQLSEGSARELKVVVLLEVTESGVVNLSVDPTIVLATSKYVDDALAALEQLFTEQMNAALDESVGTMTPEDIGAAPANHTHPPDTPTGTVVAIAGTSVPDGWLECDGASLSTTSYAGLYAVIGSVFGSGTDAFNLPDLRGEFLRGWDHGRGVDSGRNFGSYQGEAFKSHNHAAKIPNAYCEGPGRGLIYMTPNATTTSVATTAVGGTETRPRNRALMFIIKY
ncbi:phage tail protein [Desulfovibrio ferrophilus]|uniref:Tail Collar domain protein n=1 Tax=Desulfovibrio ferrophilus TaxID=241368 RepID=A0A2Z6AZ11_9BACT|nr:phage tail protein [Desulfovibrio ferrophilus]BBD08448.1 Tail Collar domain protein [Desulfovibrio ferrophilus]